MRVFSKYQYYLVFVLISNIAIGQSDSVSYKCWYSKNKLLWSDFKAKMPQKEASSEKTAVCPSEIIVKGFWEAKMPNFHVVVCFNKDLAWTKDTTSSYALAHEQLHFDISELYARKLRKIIKKMRSRYVVDIKIYRDSVQKCLLEAKALNIKYDKETAHGIYKSKQAEWEQKIALELRKLNDFASTKENCFYCLELSKENILN